MPHPPSTPLRMSTHPNPNELQYVRSMLLVQYCRWSVTLPATTLRSFWCTSTFYTAVKPSSIVFYSFSIRFYCKYSPKVFKLGWNSHSHSVQSFNPVVILHNQLEYCIPVNHCTRKNHVHCLICTAHGRYSFMSTVGA